MNSFRSLSVGVAVRAGTACVQYPLNLVIASFLGSELYGQYVYCISIAQIVCIPLSTGVSQVLIRKGQLKYRNEKAVVCYTAMLLVCIYAVTVAPLLLGWIVYFTEGKWTRQYWPPLLVLLALSQSLLQAVSINYIIYGQIEKWQVRNFLFLAIPSAVLSCLALLFFGQNRLLNVLIAVQVTASILFICTQRRIFRNRKQWRARAAEIVRASWNPMIVLVIGGLVSIFSSQLDVLIFPTLADDAILGYFRVVGRIGGVGLLALQMIEPLIVVKAGEALNAGNRHRGKVIYYRLTSAALGVSVAAALVAYFLGPLILEKMGYGGEYLPLASVIIACTNILICAFYPSMTMLIALGRVSLVMGTVVAHLFVLAVAYLVFVPNFGLVGAAIAYHCGCWVYLFPFLRTHQILRPARYDPVA